MRTITKSILAAAVMAGGLGTSAGAIQWTSNTAYTGPVWVKFSNYDMGTLYGPNPVPATATGAANVQAIAPQAGAIGAVAVSGGAYAGMMEDQWGIFNVSGIYMSGYNDVAHQVWDPNTAGYQIVGMFYGGVDTYFAQNLDGSQNIGSAGVQYAFFKNTANSFNPALGSGGRLGELSYLTVTTGAPVWTGYSIPGVSIISPLIEQYTHFTPDAAGSGNSSGDVYGAWGAINTAGGPVTGTDNGQWGALSGPIGFTVSFTGLPNVTDPLKGTVKVGDWLIQSNDPLTGYAIPTPTALWGGAVLAGLAGMNVLRRRRA